MYRTHWLTGRRIKRVPCYTAVEVEPGIFQSPELGPGQWTRAQLKRKAKVIQCEFMVLRLAGQPWPAL